MLFTFLLFAFCVNFSVCSRVEVEETDLLLAFTVFRHGDRTPVSSQTVLSDDEDTLVALSEPFGYGQLTEVGKERGYEIGKFLRSRYNDLLSPRYNSTELYLRSTDMDRTKMTALTAMSAVYPLTGRGWNPYVNWEPVPYTTLPTEDDFMSSYTSCERFSNYYLSMISPISLGYTELGASLEKYANMYEVLGEQTGINFTTNPYSLYMMYDLYQAEINLGMTLQPWLQEIWSDMEEAVQIVSTAVFGAPEARRLNGGVFLNGFLSTSQSIIDGDEVTQRVRLYSGHEFNVGGQLAAAMVPITYPMFGSTLSLELRRVRSTGQNVVLAVKVAFPGETPYEYLQVDGCSDLFCDFEEFYNATSVNALTEAEWLTECVTGDAIPYPEN